MYIYVFPQQDCIVEDVRVAAMRGKDVVIVFQMLSSTAVCCSAANGKSGWMPSPVVALANYNAQELQFDIVFEALPSFS